MTTKNIERRVEETRKLEGKVLECRYEGKGIMPRNFPTGYVAVSLKDGKSHQTIILDGLYIPPIRNGLYVEAEVREASFENSCGNDVTLLLTRRLSLLDSKGGEVLAEYSN